MEEIIELLQQIRPEVDYETVEDLIDGEYIESLDLVMIIAALEEKFDISIPMSMINPDNFNSVRGMYEMVKQLSK